MCALCCPGNFEMSKFSPILAIVHSSPVTPNVRTIDSNSAEKETYFSLQSCVTQKARGVQGVTRLQVTSTVSSGRSGGPVCTAAPTWALLLLPSFDLVLRFLDQAAAVEWKGPNVMSERWTCVVVCECITSGSGREWRAESQGARSKEQGVSSE